jgi:hypothetical protein
MATIKRISDGIEVRLRPTHVLGRHPSCDLSLSHPLVSGHHARIRYQGGAWELRDMNSRNGTLVDGSRLSASEVISLSAGQELLFGTPEQRWTVVDVAPPGLFAERIDGDGELRSESDLLALPDEENPVVTVYQDQAGFWVIEREGAVQRIADRHEVEIDGSYWVLHLPGVDDGTQELQATVATVDALRLEFAVSADEEHVELRAVHGSREYDLKSRAHHYLLLTLARQRMEDAEDPDEPESAHGWVYQDELSRMLRLDDNAIYLAVYRARKQLKTAGISGAAGIVERRAATRQLRIGVSSLVVRRI